MYLKGRPLTQLVEHQPMETKVGGSKVRGFETLRGQTILTYEKDDLGPRFGNFNGLLKPILYLTYVSYEID